MTGKVALGEICQFVGGGTPSRKVRRYWDGDIPWATVKDFGSEQIFTTAEFISQEGLVNSASNVVPAGTVLLVTRVGLGKVAIAGVDLAINQDVKAITSSNDVLPEFLFWSLKRLGPEIESMGAGATVKGVTLQDVRELEIPLPPLDEQRRIVGILRRSAKIERMSAQAEEQLREFLPALFVKMFGDPIENPMGWVRESLGTLIKDGPQNGLYKPKSVYGSGTSILRIDGFCDGRVTDPAEWRRLRLDEATIKKYALLEDDIIINRVNSRPFLGKSAIIPKIVEPAIFESNMMRLRLDVHRILPKFLISILQLEPVRQVLCANAKDAINQSSINQADVRELLVIVPPLDLQHKYTRIAETVRSTVVVTEHGISAASELSAALMDRELN